MNKQIVFLSGLPRTGSTLLGAIFSQNPNVFVTATSPLVYLMLGAKQTCEGIAKPNLTRTNRLDFQEELLAEIPRLFFRDIKQPIIIDKQRAWTRDGEALRYYASEKPRIVTMLRPIVEIVQSLVYVRKKNGDILPESNLLGATSPLRINIQNVAWALQQQDDEQLFCTYEQLLSKPRDVIAELSNFWGIPPFDYDLENIKLENTENEYGDNTHDYHSVRSVLQKKDRNVKISASLMNLAKQMDEALWHDYQQAKKINPRRFIA